MVVAITNVLGRWMASRADSNWVEEYRDMIMDAIIKQGMCTASRD